MRNNDKDVIILHDSSSSGWMIKRLNDERSFKIVMYPRETTGHNKPHVHIYLDGGSSNAECFIDTIKLFNLKGKAKEKDYAKAIEWIKNNIQNVRKEWNDFAKSNYKFKSI